ncbi:hypothetical protein L3X38_004439 [Prunus dulcis]|uniref:Uncharacterized protein n=1 Tax=Prunus dulcis TaxID=3755 RepID=A0AAD4ZNW8_PRUDU|nr:hypothetical protein L3X38_004439 [Prunus dulcis]
MPGEKIDRCRLWKKAREDKQRNIPDPKDDLQKQVSKGTLTIFGSNDILTLALGTPEHGGRVRDNPTNDVEAAEKRQDEMDLSKLDMAPPLLALCQFVQTNLAPTNDTMKIHIPAEVFGTDHDTFPLVGRYFIVCFHD